MAAGNRLPRPSKALTWVSFALPPTLEEQRAIARQIEGNCRSIDIAIGRTQREIELVREYRTRLIADVVTGKSDVRRLTESRPSDGFENSDELEFALIEAYEIESDVREFDGEFEGD